MNEMNISLDGGRGRMWIYLDVFFPCTKEKFKKLLNIIEQDFESCDEHKENLKVYFQNCIQDNTEKWKTQSKRYWDNRQKVADISNIVNIRKHPSGVAVTKEEYKTFCDELRKCKHSMKQNERCAKEAKRNIEKFRWYLETIEQGR